MLLKINFFSRFLLLPDVTYLASSISLLFYHFEIARHKETEHVNVQHSSLPKERK